MREQGINRAALFSEGSYSVHPATSLALEICALRERTAGVACRASRGFRGRDRGRANALGVRALILSANQTYLPDFNLTIAP